MALLTPLKVFTRAVWGALLVLATLIAVRAEAGEVIGIGKRILKFAVVIDPKQTGAEVVMRGALMLVSAAAPNGIILQKGEDTLDFIIEVTDSKSMQVDIETHRAQGAILASTADAYTLVLQHRPNGPFVVRMLWDRLTTHTHNRTAVPRPDAFARVVAALGHEIYGNVRTFVSRNNILSDPSRLYSDRFQLSDQAAFEVAAFRAGIEMLVRAREILSKTDLSAKLRADIEAALERERQALTSWTEALVESDSAGRKIVSLRGSRCEALFGSAP